MAPKSLEHFLVPKCLGSEVFRTLRHRLSYQLCVFNLAGYTNRTQDTEPLRHYSAEMSDTFPYQCVGYEVSRDWKAARSSNLAGDRLGRSLLSLTEKLTSDRARCIVDRHTRSDRLRAVDQLTESRLLLDELSDEADGIRSNAGQGREVNGKEGKMKAAYPIDDRALLSPRNERRSTLVKAPTVHCY